jgi:hypothetical protein
MAVLPPWLEKADLAVSVTTETISDVGVLLERLPPNLHLAQEG